MPWLVILAWTLHAVAVNAAAPRHYPAFDTTGVYTFPFDDAHLLSPHQHDAGAVWVTPNARPGDALPLYIYLHGLNRGRILRRWLHGSHWDLRTIVGPLAMHGRVGPMAVAVPATTGDGALAASTIYARFDPAAFVEATAGALAAHGYRLDRDRVIFSAHSASGCAPGNGLYAAVGSPAVQTVLDIDCCMDPRFARTLATAPGSQRVIVVYQDFMWNIGRNYPGFTDTFLRLSALSPTPMHRVLERYRMQGIDVHNDIVPLALRRWLPELVPPPRSTTVIPAPEPGPGRAVPEAPSIARVAPRG